MINGGGVRINGERVGDGSTALAAGEVTRVRNNSTNESYSARVVGDGVVLVSAR